jgi:VanZ family protein
MPIAFSKNSLLAFAIIIFIACNSLFFTPGKELPKLGDWFGDFSFDKLIHTAIFCGMCFLFMSYAVLFSSSIALNKTLIFITILFLLWAVATELIQSYFIEGRTGSLMDVLADAAGVLLALLLIKMGLVKKLFVGKQSSI